VFLDRVLHFCFASFKTSYLYLLHVWAHRCNHCIQPFMVFLYGLLSKCQ
jgi:hypothetical protein